MLLCISSVRRFLCTCCVLCSIPPCLQFIAVFVVSFDQPMPMLYVGGVRVSRSTMAGSGIRMLGRQNVGADVGYHAISAEGR